MSLNGHFGDGLEARSEESALGVKPVEGEILGREIPPTGGKLQGIPIAKFRVMVALQHRSDYPGGGQRFHVPGRQDPWSAGIMPE